MLSVTFAAIIFISIELCCEGFMGFFNSLRRSTITMIDMSGMEENLLNNQSFAPILKTNFDEYQNSISKGFIPIGPTDIDKVDPLNSQANRRSPTTLKYFQIVEKLAPNEMLQKFAETAPKNVQEAAKSTIVSILGSLPNYALDASLITTSSKLANLLYQMQMTGYMFKNAEYRMSFSRTLKGLPKLPSQASVNKGNVTFNPAQDGTRVIGEAIVRTAKGDRVEVDVNDLMDALRKEVEELRTELSAIRNDKEQELRSTAFVEMQNLLTYIRAMPDREMLRLTSDMSEDVVETIQMLVNALMERLGIDTTGPEVILQQSVAALAQLCMWQMVVGYKLRELEAFDRGAAFTIDDL